MQVIMLKLNAYGSQAGCVNAEAQESWGEEAVAPSEGDSHSHLCGILPCEIDEPSNTGFYKCQ